MERIIASLTLNQLNDPPSLTLDSTLVDLPDEACLATAYTFGGRFTHDLPTAARMNSRPHKY